MAKRALRIHPEDDVAVVLEEVSPGEEVEAEGASVVALERVERGHKVALRPLERGRLVVKYGFPIGRAKLDIPAGSWVHSHNLESALSEGEVYSYGGPKGWRAPRAKDRSFMGYRRPDGSVGIRNEIWVIPTVGCINDLCRGLALWAKGAFGDGVEDVVALTHPFGCSQLGDDHERTRRVLASLACHPNACGVLLVGLGCENNQLEELMELIDPPFRWKVRSMVVQRERDEVEVGKGLLGELRELASGFEREEIHLGELVLGLKCGGSDAFSGITANPLVGRVCDEVIALGGSALLSEVPEMFGAERTLMERAESLEVFSAIVDLIEGFKRYFTSNGHPVYENPSPGNRAGGITTLEEKSLGCVQKGGSSPVVDVIPYGGRTRKRGLSLLEAPGNDLVSSTALAAAGAHLVLFTTGRGTPYGTVVPTLKISSNGELASGKPRWVDFDAGRLLSGESAEALAEEMLELVVQVASGKRTKNEENGHKGIAIWKDGVTL